MGQPQCLGLFNLEEGFHWRNRTGWSKSTSLEDDGFWHFGVVISLRIKNAARYIPFHLALKKEDDEFVIKIEEWNLSEWESQFRIQPNNREELHKLYDTIFNFIKDDMENGLKNLLNKQKNPTFGFQLLTDVDESTDDNNSKE